MKTCKECIHFEACVETIRAFGFEVSTDNLKQRVCPLFRNKGGNDWIPVKEEKPQEFVSVLVYVPGEAPLPTVREAYLARGCWVTHTTILTEREVTHWMEMPAGPESKK